MNRRTFLKKSGILAAAASLPLLYSWQIEPFWVEFVQLDMPIKNLPDHLEGKTLMQISDLHVGNRFDWKFLTESFEEAKKYQPDFVVYTGDFVNSGTPYELESLQTVLHDAVRGKIATLGILGNHDYGVNWAENHIADQVAAIAENNGIKMLLNHSESVSGLNFIGFEDLWSSRFDSQTLEIKFNDSQANIVLCHNPDACDLEIWNGYSSWILSGHTHGGQCRIPGVGASLLPIKNKLYVSGKFDLGNGRTLYVNRALGHSLQVRFMVRPEITLFTLRKSIS